MGWKTYALAMLLFNFAGLLVVYLLQRLQGVLPLNPQGLGAVTPDSSFNTAVSFATNTNWQGYGGETTMSYLTQMLGLTVQNFVSAAAGMATLAAFIRGFSRRSAETIGNFWVDLTRTTLYILLPLSFVLALVLVSQGVVQTFGEYAKVTVVQPTQYDVPETDKDGKPVLDDKGQPKMTKATLSEQVLAVGPAASQIAIKQLGTNGGGFFNVNSAHPVRERDAALELPRAPLDPRDLRRALLHVRRHGRGHPPGLGRPGRDDRRLRRRCSPSASSAEQRGCRRSASLGVDHQASDLQAGGNMEGKEVRFGIANSALWATATTAASNGSVNSMHDSFTPIGGLVPMWLMQLGEVIYGGVGSGLYGMLVFAIIAVFVAGLMVGRTPEYLGKKIEAYEMKMASLVILIPPAVVLIGTAIARGEPRGHGDHLQPRRPRLQRGALRVLVGRQQQRQRLRRPRREHALLQHGARARHALRAATGWRSRRWRSRARSRARRRCRPGPARCPRTRRSSSCFLIGVVVLVGALTFIPALALGPIVEHLMITAVKP